MNGIRENIGVENEKRNGKVDNGIEIKRIGKHTNSHLDLKHTNGTSSINPGETTLRNVENNIIEQSTTSTMVNKTGNWLIYGGYSHCDHFSGRGYSQNSNVYFCL